MTTTVRGQLMHIITDTSSRVITIAERTLEAPLRRERRGLAQELASVDICRRALHRAARTAAPWMRVHLRTHTTTCASFVRITQRWLHALPAEVPYV